MPNVTESSTRFWIGARWLRDTVLEGLAYLGMPCMLFPTTPLVMTWFTLQSWPPRILVTLLEPIIAWPMIHHAPSTRHPLNLTFLVSPVPISQLLASGRREQGSQILSTWPMGSTLQFTGCPCCWPSVPQTLDWSFHHDFMSYVWV